MSDPDDPRYFPAKTAAIDSSLRFPMDSDATAANEIHLPLLNLTKLRSRLDHVQRVLSDSVNSSTILGEEQMEIVCKEISSAINQVIVNGAAILSCSGLPEAKSENPNLPLASTSLTFDGKNLSESELNLNDSKDDIDLGFPKVEVLDEEIGGDWDIVELDAVELLAEHLHFCDFCGKGFKRDANLRMHMRAHGNKYKTLEALAKPEKSVLASELTRGGRTRFSCPFAGCNRNKLHKKFRPLKSVICVKNHFKRSHCTKMYSCNRCHKKNFSVLADLKSHLKHCGETKWKCSCGTSFSRKDKLFRHMALFEGHMPAIAAEVVAGEDGKGKGVVAMVAEDAEDRGSKLVKRMEGVIKNMDVEFFDGLPDGFDSIDDFCIPDVLSIDWSL